MAPGWPLNRTSGSLNEAFLRSGGRQAGGLPCLPVARVERDADHVPSTKRAHPKQRPIDLDAAVFAQPADAPARSRSRPRRVELDVRSSSSRPPRKSPRAPRAYRSRTRSTSRCATGAVSRRRLDTTVGARRVSQVTNLRVHLPRLGLSGAVGGDLLRLALGDHEAVAVRGAEPQLALGAGVPQRSGQPLCRWR
jgi:hypothetical protein